MTPAEAKIMWTVVGRGLTFGDNRWSKTYMPIGPHTALCALGTGSKEDTFVEETTVTFTKHIGGCLVSTQSELGLKTVEVPGV